MLIQRIGKGAAILMALSFAAMADLPIRYLSLLALFVILIWVGFAWYAGRSFEALTAPKGEVAPPVSTPAPARA